MIPDFKLSVLQKKIAFSTIVQYAGKFVHMGLAIIATKLISNFLTVQDYSIYGKVVEYAGFFSVVANLGIVANLIRRMADEPSNGALFVNSLVLRILTAFVFFIIGTGFLLMSDRNFTNPAFLIATALLFGSLLLDYVTAICDGMLQANYSMGRATVALLAGKLSHVLIIYFIVNSGVTVDVGLPLILGGALFASVITASLSLFFVSRKIKLIWRFDHEFMWTILKGGIAFGIINIFNNLYFRFLPDYFAHLALGDNFSVFNVSFRVSQVLSLFSTYVVLSMLPGFKQYIDQKHWQKAQKIYIIGERFLLLCGVLLVIFGSLLGPFFIELVTNKNYFVPEYWFMLPMMLFLTAISYIYDVILITLFALENDKWLVKIEALALACSLPLFLASMWVPNVPLKLILIISAAIIGESMMVIIGSFRARKLLKLHAMQMPGEEGVSPAKA